MFICLACLRMHARHLPPAYRPTDEELGLHSDEDAEAEEQEEQEEHGDEAPDEAEGEEGQGK